MTASTAAPQVRVAEDERFLRDGSDLVSVVDVPAPAAALGTRVTVETLDGPEEIDVPAGTQPGTVVERQRELLTELGESIGDENLRESQRESMFEKVRRALR